MTTAWTEASVRLGLCWALLLGAGVLAGRESITVTGLLAGLALACALVAQRHDGFVGALVGLAAAALLIVGKQVLGVWGADHLALSAIEVVTLIAVGWVVGDSGKMLRSTAVALAKPRPGALVPAYHSLGLLDATPALFRLDEEITRRTRTGSPLSVLLIGLSSDGKDPDAPVAVAARRAAARTAETLLRDTDVPFAPSDHELAAILPDTDATSAWTLAGVVVEAMGRATFADRATGERRRLSDVTTIDACVVAVTDQRADSHGILEMARAGLHRPSDRGSVRDNR